MNKITTILLCLTSTIALKGCGTLTGIPAHGGGKRFIEEQRTVSASVRGALEAINIRPLAGKRVALIFSLISDEGAGNISGGRATLTGLLSTATMVSPILARSNAVEVFQLLSGGTSSTNTTSAGSGSNQSQMIIVGANTGISTTSSNGSTTSSSSNNQSASGSNTGTSSTNSSGTSGSTTTTGPTTTTQTGTSTGSSNTNSSGTSTSTSSGTDSSSGTSTLNATTNSSDTSNSTNNGSGSSLSNSTTAQNGVTTGTRQEPVYKGFKEQTKGTDHRAQATLQYKGLGDYSVLSVPKSDASLLMSLTRNYFLLNGSTVTTPTDPTAEVVVYVTVDIFGINRQRTDLIVYNNESLKAETAIEMFAADRTGRIIMRPTVGNTQTYYKEEYIGWAGPFATKRGIRKGEGLLQDFTDQ